MAGFKVNTPTGFAASKPRGNQWTGFGSKASGLPSVSKQLSGANISKAIRGANKGLRFHSSFRAPKNKVAIKMVKMAKTPKIPHIKIPKMPKMPIGTKSIASTKIF